MWFAVLSLPLPRPLPRDASQSFVHIETFKAFNDMSFWFIFIFVFNNFANEVETC